jgi:hypothetical protein
LVAAAVVYALWAVALQPKKASISIMETFPVSKKHTLAHVSEAADVPCLRAQDVLYPPCFVTGRLRFDLIPLPPLTSVMELAVVRAATSAEPPAASERAEEPEEPEETDSEQ